VYNHSWLVCWFGLVNVLPQLALNLNPAISAFGEARSTIMLHQPWLKVLRFVLEQAVKLLCGHLEFVEFN
jgi:hypothetical protein